MCVRFVVPTSRRLAPLCSMISGIRNPSPISISSPRETTTSPPRASAASVTSTAAAQLFTTMAASAPVKRVNSSVVCTSRFPRAPASRSYSRLLYCVALRRNSSTTVSVSGARPKFVCKITPVALITGCSDRERIRSTSLPMSSSTEAAFSPSAVQFESPARRERRSASTSRETSTTRLRSTCFESAASLGWASNSSTDGIWRSNSACSAEIVLLLPASMRTFQHTAGSPAIPPSFPVGFRARSQCAVADSNRGPFLRLTVLFHALSMEVRGFSPLMATIDEELATLDKGVRPLKVEYDQYFGGGRKRPPTEIEWRIDMMIKRYSERGGELKFAQRFRFNNLSQTYAKYKDIFRKKVKQKEEGTVQRHFGAAAKEIEAARAKEHPEEEAAAVAVGGKSFRMTCSEPERETEKVDQLYQAFLQAKQTAGEATGKLSRSSFNEFVLKKTKELQKQKNCRDVEYVVEVVEGQVKLKALVKS